MKRWSIEKLKQWKASPNRKPLLLLGARQVGKTWLMKEFGAQCYRNIVYVRFDTDTTMKTVFEKDYRIPRILNDLKLYTGDNIIPGDTLIILDEIQECPSALTSLKYFCEEAREHHIIAAGSLLGVAEHRGTGFPVGKVNRMYLGPMSFTEFLEASGQGEFVKLIQSKDWDTMSRFQERLIEHLRYYYYVGGMPEVVSTFISTGSFKAAREVQLNLLADYQDDFSKHATPAESHLISQIWKAVPSQLAQENKRFIQNVAVPGVKSDRLRGPMRWLNDAGMVNIVQRVTRPEAPLDAFCDGAFKLFFLDIGLLGARCKLESAALLKGASFFGQFKGALTEQYVQQQITSELGSHPYYWSAEKAQAEVDFLFDAESEIVPLEVRAELNLRAKSLQSFYRRYRRPLAVRTSMSQYSANTVEIPATKDSQAGSYRLIDLPLYAISLLAEVVADELKRLELERSNSDLF